jgi:hypothetical protein
MAEGGGDQKASGAPTDAHDVFVSSPQRTTPPRRGNEWQH